MNIQATMVLHIIRICAQITTIWPSSPDRNFLERLFRQVLWIISMLNALALLIPIGLGAYHNYSEPQQLMKSLSEGVVLTTVCADLLLYRWKENQMRILVDEVTSFIMTANKESRIILNKWTNYYLPMWIGIITGFAIAVIFFSFSPFFSSQLLPASTWYPFVINKFTIWYYALFFQHVITICQAGLTITTDVTISFLFCYLSVKLELLEIQFRNSKSHHEFTLCFKTHQHCIKYFDLLSNTTRFIILKNHFLMALTIIFGAVPLLYPQPFVEGLSFLSNVIGSNLRIYLNTLPADDLRQMSENLVRSMYDYSWIYSSTTVRKSMIFAICRAQQAFIISIPGLLPPITLRYYASFVSSTVSCFATIRAVLEKRNSEKTDWI